jgi:hypothetical protein
MDKKILHLQSKRKREKLSYNFDRKNKNGSRWRCVDRACKGYIIVGENEIVLKEAVHSCFKTCNDGKADVIKDEIRKKLEYEDINIKNAITKIITSTTPDVMLKLPPVKSLIDTFRKKQDEKNKKSLNFYDEIPNFYKNTKSGKQFLFHDSGFSDQIELFCLLQTFYYHI